MGRIERTNCYTLKFKLFKSCHNVKLTQAQLKSTLQIRKYVCEWQLPERSLMDTITKYFPRNGCL